MFNCDIFPRLDTYARAKAHYENVMPMKRGDTKGYKPINLRTHYHKYDLIVQDGDNLLWVYQHAPANSSVTRDAIDNYYVKWLPNGEIHVRVPMYNCVQDRLSTLLGLNFFRQNNALWVNTYNTLQLRKRDDDEPNVFKRGTTGYLELVNPKPRSKMLLKRAQANNVRARYSDFRKYLAGNIKLREEGKFTLQECHDMFGSDFDGVPSNWWGLNTPTNLIAIKSDKRSAAYEVRDTVVDDLLELITSGDPEKYYRATLWVMCSASDYSFGNTRQTSEKSALKMLDEVLFYKHKDEVFYEKPLAGNDTSRDIWEWVFK